MWLKRNYYIDVQYCFCLSLFFVASVSVSCSNSQQHTQIIPEAKRIVDEHPDSAYVLLKKVDFNGLTDNESKALYALIHSKTNMYMGHYFQI